MVGLARTDCQRYAADSKKPFSERDFSDAMTDRRLPPNGLPDWPRGLTESLAAAYVGVGAETFRLEVKAGIWPKPRRAGAGGGLNVWDRHLIDAAYDRLSNPSQGPAKAPAIMGRFERWGKSA